MRRSGPPERRTPLSNRQVPGDRQQDQDEKHDRQDNGPRRDAISHAPRRTRRIAPQSAARVAAAPAREEVRLLLFARDRGRCLLAPSAGRWMVWTASGVEWDTAGGQKVTSCYGGWTPHHVEKAWKGSAYDLANLVTLCAGHNGWVENYPDAALALGLVVGRGVSHAMAAARRRAAGLYR